MLREHRNSSLNRRKFALEGDKASVKVAGIPYTFQRYRYLLWFRQVLCCMNGGALPDRRHGLHSPARPPLLRFILNKLIINAMRCIDTGASALARLLLKGKG